MSFGSDILDEYGMLTQNGKQIMQLGLRDPATADYMFAQIHAILARIKGTMILDLFRKEVWEENHTPRTTT